ncbi:TnsD family Tn7-like transposition protein [Shewanella mangrovisoli]|uniref:TnsD family Tn7-like transposition protein n=1 Tax=Shewanella mangrovisoli TaxID=2864211 RepID=UPI0035B9F15D
MLGFPVPYPEELIYSVVARARIHSGITSPKQLLDEIFENRKVIATVDLPSHLTAISNQYPESLSLTTHSLMYNHTLFPLYAPFIDEQRRQNCMHWMALQSNGRAHLALGINASVIKRSQFLRYCPQCFNEQVQRYGERFWERMWQIPYANWCVKHSAPLYAFSIVPHHEHRHLFYAADVTSEDKLLGEYEIESLRIGQFATQLMQVKPQESPTYFQWDCFYHDLLVDAGCKRGAKIEHDEVLQRIRSSWREEWLSYVQLKLTISDACWARTILRKHRKSFNFIQHFILQSCLLSKDISPLDVLEKVKSYPKQKRTIQNIHEINQKDISKRQRWFGLLKELGTKQARLHGSQDLYMWLYRHDYEWLMKINKRYQRAITYEDKRVNWQKRDRTLVRELFRLLHGFDEVLDAPRLSSTYLLSQLGLGTLSTKQYRKLPLTAAFLSKYSESIYQYQIRRLTRQYIDLFQRHIKIERWKLLRCAGLSEERLQPLTQSFLSGILEGKWTNTDLSTSPKMP